MQPAFKKAGWSAWQLWLITSMYLASAAHPVEQLCKLMLKSRLSAAPLQLVLYGVGM